MKALLLSELNRLRRFSYSLTGNSADADDLVQSIIEKVLVKGLPQDAKVFPWLVTLCKNLWLDELRARGVRSRYATQNQMEENSGDTTEAALVHHRLIEAISHLSEEHRLVVCLVIVEGFSYKEAAEIIGCPAGTVMSRLARAREKMTLELQELRDD